METLNNLVVNDKKSNENMVYPQIVKHCSIYAILVILIMVQSIAFASSGSSEKIPPNSFPAWLNLKIADFIKLPVSSPPRSILVTEYQGKKVYYVSPICCDIPSELYDEKGNLLCYPHGSFSGGDTKCSSFKLDKKSSKTIWTDTRKRPLKPHMKLEQ